MYLLDANLLIALGDPNHIHHGRARGWFLSAQREGWATCPITENAFIRILGHPNYPEFGGDCNDARAALRVLTSASGHQFWSDDLSITDSGMFPKLAGSKLLTDVYLLGLAVHRHGEFATFDERIRPGLVPGGGDAYFLVP